MKKKRNKREREKNTFYIFEVNSSPIEIQKKKIFEFSFCQLNYTVRPSDGGDDNDDDQNEEFNVIK